MLLYLNDELTLEPMADVNAAHAGRHPPGWHRKVRQDGGFLGRFHAASQLPPASQ